MIFFYTRTQKTKAIAEALHKVLGLPLYELRSPLSTDGILSLIKCTLFALIGRAAPVTNMPAAVNGDTLFVCSPVWAGRVAPPVRYFLNRAELRGKTVHMLLTCASVTGGDAYKAAALEAVKNGGGTPGTVLVFATDKNPPDPETITEQLRVMLAKTDA